MNVRELRDLLAAYPADSAVGVLAVSPSGQLIDVTAADVVTVDATISDAGTPARVWVTGAGDSDTPAPALITLPCPCGDVIVVSERASWPRDHGGHLSVAD